MFENLSSDWGLINQTIPIYIYMYIYIFMHIIITYYNLKPRYSQLQLQSFAGQKKGRHGSPAGKEMAMGTATLPQQVRDLGAFCSDCCDTFLMFVLPKSNEMMGLWYKDNSTCIFIHFSHQKVKSLWNSLLYIYIYPFTRPRRCSTFGFVLN